VNVVIVGAGQGGLQVAASLRTLGFDGRVTLIGTETDLPYQRPPLSKAVLAGRAEPADATLRPEAFFAERSIDLLRGERVTTIRRAERRICLAVGGSIAYDHLVLATGAVNRRLALPGVELDGVLSLRTADEAVQLRARLQEADRVAIIGAGFIGLEVAAVACAAGRVVDVFEIAARPMGRVVSAHTSRFFAEAHRRSGVRLHLGTGVRRITGAGGRVTGVEVAEGMWSPADVVLVAVGIEPDDSLAAAAGLPVRAGVCVDQRLATPDPAISAIGDCARFPCRFAASPVVLESVQNAADQGRAVAGKLIGRDEPYAAVPWFWSDQGELRLQIAGLTVGARRTVVSGDPESGRFSALCFAGERLLGVESVGRPGDHVAARKLLAAAGGLTPAQASQPGFDLKAYARAA
jgi:3-phenylpropionate/trans-cinnamate dioxygenase ferredoxin reductase component